ncbi:hypothetical protein MRX96_037218 [Rhipicephalus microplus]
MAVEAARAQLLASSPRHDSACPEQQQQATFAAGSCVLRALATQLPSHCSRQACCSSPTWCRCTGQHGFLESINRSLGFDVAPASPVVEFMAMLGFGLILLFEMMSSWLAIKATTLESRWLLLPFIGLTTCGIVSPALMSAVIMLSSQRFHTIPLPITTLIPVFFVILTRTYFLLLSVSYYRELQERESRQEETLPSVASQVPQGVRLYM